MLLTPRQFAKRIAKGHNFVRALIKAGEIEVIDQRSPAARLPRYMIDEKQVEEWQRSRRMRITPQRSQKRKAARHRVLEVIH